MLVVSVLQIVLDLPQMHSLKDKRSVVKSLKDRLQQKFHMSVAEVGGQDSLGFAHLGAAVVSNSKTHGEAVLTKALAYAEEHAACRISDARIFSEAYD